eukprot:TRINITY_DN810_c0_g1_i1.p1 TRINITY_DN810_c0_g1~~TRINITY_DN810_c0_g1_i1.p1  ORF type:complete len:544 (+),score=258.73 TRINITY_DN810_c0_g1_i1:42-1673(+)
MQSTKSNKLLNYIKNNNNLIKNINFKRNLNTSNNNKNKDCNSPGHKYGSCPCHSPINPLFFNRKPTLNQLQKFSKKITTFNSNNNSNFNSSFNSNFNNFKLNYSSSSLNNSRFIDFQQLPDFAFEMATSNIRFGFGVTNEVGFDLKDLGLKNVVVFTDQQLINLKPVQTVLESLQLNKINYKIYDQVRVEPTDSSFKQAIDFVNNYDFDGYVAVGGGSVMDTAKAANLYSTYPDDFLAYVNPPIGQGKPVPGPLKPMIAIPTTAGTGSETTGVAIFDLESINAKTGIAHRRLKPTLGLVDPENTRTLPPEVAAASGFDVLCHSLESYTAIPFDQRKPRPERPLLRPAYQGSNPISDVWSLKALEMVSEWLPRAFEDPSDDIARANVILAATYAGIGFGNAGVHLCHGMSYPIAGMVRDYKPPGYNSLHPLIPHGISVVMNAPAVFRFTSSACTDRHMLAAKLMGANVTGASQNMAGELLAERILILMQKLKVPNGLLAIGFNENDIEQLVEGTLPQHRVTKLSPKPVTRDDLIKLFKQTMTVY